MKIKFEFDPDVDGDMERYELFSDAENLYQAMWNFKQELRKIWKYEEHSQEVTEMVDKIYALLHDAMIEAGVKSDI